MLANVVNPTKEGFVNLLTKLKKQNGAYGEFRSRYNYDQMEAFLTRVKKSRSIGYDDYAIYSDKEMSQLNHMNSYYTAWGAATLAEWLQELFRHRRNPSKYGNGRCIIKVVGPGVNKIENIKLEHVADYYPYFEDYTDELELNAPNNVVSSDIVKRKSAQEEEFSLLGFMPEFSITDREIKGDVNQIKIKLDQEHFKRKCSEGFRNPCYVSKKDNITTKAYTKGAIAGAFSSRLPETEKILIERIGTFFNSQDGAKMAMVSKSAAEEAKNQAEQVKKNKLSLFVANNKLMPKLHIFLDNGELTFAVVSEPKYVEFLYRIKRSADYYELTSCRHDKAGSYLKHRLVILNSDVNQELVEKFLLEVQLDLDRAHGRISVTEYYKSVALLKEYKCEISETDQTGKALKIR